MVGLRCATTSPRLEVRGSRPSSRPTIRFPGCSRFRFWPSSSARGSPVATASETARLIETPLLVMALEDERWLDFVVSHPEALPFHHPSWARVVSESYDYPSFVLAVSDEEGRITAGMPVLEIRKRFRSPRWVSLPFTDRCPPLATDRIMTARLVSLADRAREQANVARLEVHADLPGGDVHRRRRGVGYVLPLSLDPKLTF